MDAGSMLGLTWGLIAGWCAWKGVFYIGWALYQDEQWRRYEDMHQRMERMSSNLFASMRDAGMFAGLDEEVEETVH